MQWTEHTPLCYLHSQNQTEISVLLLLQKPEKEGSHCLTITYGLNTTKQE